MLEHLEKLRDSDIERKSLGWQKEQVGLGKLGPWNSDLDPRILLDDYLSKNNPAYHRELVRRSERRIVPGH